MTVVETSPAALRARAPIPQRARPEHVPLSFPQQRLWFLDQLAPGNPFYVETSALRISAEVNARALELSINAVVKRHEVLRTAFRVHDGEPCQMISDEMHVPLEHVDLRSMPEAHRSAEMMRIIQRRATTPFDLETPPLVRCGLIRLSTHEHVLVLALHHIITDGWSMQVFSHEVSTLYRCLLEQQPVELPELVIQNADYALWQRSHDREAVVDLQLDYWRNQLASLPILALPTDFDRPAVQTYQGSEVSVTVPNRCADDVMAFARSEGSTPFMVGFAAWAMLLSRYCDQNDVAVGVPIAGRDRPELEHLVGCFLNNLVIRVDLDATATFRELVAHTRRQVVDGFAHQDVPFDRLVEELHPARDLSRHPLFSVMFQFFNTDANPEHGPGNVKVQRTTAIVDLFMHLWDEGGGIRGKIEYSTDLFERQAVADMARHFVVLLTAALQRPDAPLESLPLVTKADRAELARLALGEPLELQPEQTLPAMWRLRLKATPHQTALIDGRDTWTYEQVQGRIDEIAALISQHELPQRSIVGVCLPRSVDAIASFLAITQMGHAWVTLDPNYPPAALDHVVHDSKAALVLGDANGADLINANEASFVDVSKSPVVQRAAEATDCTEPLPADLACLIYTSGSTGRPKGVMVEHRGIANRLGWMWDRFPFQAGEVMATKTALSFVDCLWEIFGPLCAGVPTVIVDDATVRDPHALVDLLAQNRVSRVLVVPSLLRSILDTDREIGLELAQLKTWFTSGEALGPDVVRRFESFAPDAELINLYGSSEIGGDVTAQVVTVGNRGIGRPIANTTIHLVDDSVGEPTPIGVPGDIYVGGANLARGYFGRPGLTAENFVPDPFASSPGERLFVTGDRGRWRRDGMVEFLGRQDHQVKLRGFRIELGHIEQVLTDHDGVSEAVVTLVDADEETARLVAYYEGPADIAEVRSHARTMLASHMTPGAFVRVERIPRQANGKLNRLALVTEAQPIIAEHAHEPPISGAEQRLAAMWAELLGREQIGRSDNFFDLGGHSLLATRLVSLIRDELDVVLALTTVFEQPELSEMALCVEEAIRQDLAGLTPAQIRDELERDCVSDD